MDSSGGCIVQLYKWKGEIVNVPTREVLVVEYRSYAICRWRGDDLSFFEYLSPFFFCQLSFIVLFPFLIKYYHILFIIIVFWLGCDRPSGLLLFVPAVLFFPY